jgi:hypothetical protein
VASVASFADAPLTGFPFVLHAVRLAAVELAHRYIFRNFIHDLALYELPQPMKGALSCGTIAVLWGHLVSSDASGPISEARQK